MKYKIQVMGPDRNVLGYWRNFQDGSVRLFDSKLSAQQVIENWGIDGIIVSA